MKMRKNCRRYLSLSVCSMLVLLSALSCGQQTDVQNDSTAVTSSVSVETEPLITPDLPDKKWTGETFSVYCRYGDHVRAGMGDTVYLAEATGDVLDDAIYERMRNVSERFDISFEVYASNNDLYGDSAQNIVLAGDDTYQLIIAHAGHSIGFAQNGLALDWNDLEYVDFSKPWWSKDAAKSLSMGNKTYLVADDITHNSLAETQAMLFNKVIFDNCNLEYPYQLVRDDKWTFDKMREYVTTTARDLNGDTEFKITDDRFGYVTNTWGGPIFVLGNAGVRVCEVDKNGVIQLTINSQKTVDVFEKFFAMVDEAYVYCDNRDVATEAFRGGRATFLPESLMYAESMRDMEQEFGIVPAPKFDETVEGYPTLVDGGANVLIVPVTVQNTEMVSAVLEDIAYENNRVVYPAYYEKVLKSKTAIDKESSDMIDIIKEGRVFDVGYYYAGSAFRYTGKDLCALTDRGFASYYAANEAKALADIAAMNKVFGGE